MMTVTVLHSPLPPKKINKIKIPFKIKQFLWTGKVVWSLKELATKPEDLGSIPRTHLVEGKNEVPQAVFQFHAYTPPIHSNNCNVKIDSF